MYIPKPRKCSTNTTRFSDIFVNDRLFSLAISSYSVLKFCNPESFHRHQVSGVTARVLLYMSAHQKRDLVKNLTSPPQDKPGTQCHSWIIWVPPVRIESLMQHCPGCRGGTGKAECQDSNQTYSKCSVKLSSITSNCTEILAGRQSLVEIARITFFTRMNVVTFCTKRMDKGEK